jgi:hypothetical protein
MIVAALGLDVSAFASGATRAASMAGGLGSVGSTLAKAYSIAGQAIGYAMNGAAAAIAGVAATAVGLKTALNEGRELTGLAMETGVAIDRLVILRGVFESVGLGAEEASNGIGHMQRAIVDTASGSGNAIRAFGLLKLSAQNLATMTADQQLLVIGEAISKVGNAALKSELAFEIFGKGGRRLLPFLTKGGFQNIETVLGEQARALQKNAGVFDAAAGMLSLTKIKLSGFFIGMADSLVSVLMPVIEKLTGINFLKWGQDIGLVFGSFIESIASGETSKLVTLAFSIGMQAALDGFLIALSVGIENIFTAAATLLAYGLKLAVLGIAQALITVINSIIDSMINTLMDRINSIMSFFGKGEKDRKPSTPLTDSSDAFFEYQRALERNFTSESLSKNAKDLGQRVSGGISESVSGISNSPENKALQEELKKQREKAAKDRVGIDQKYPSFTPGGPAPLMVAPKTEMISSSLAKIGGGGGFAYAERKNTQQLIQAQSDNTRALNDLTNAVKAMPTRSSVMQSSAEPTWTD